MQLLGTPREEKSSWQVARPVSHRRGFCVPSSKGCLHRRETPMRRCRRLIFDTVFNSFRGIIAYFKIVNGVIRKGDLVKFINTGKEYEADEVGILRLNMGAS